MNPKNLRIGQGYDIHPLVKGRKLLLGGVEIKYEKGLDGNSDADVLLHALCDALIGAVGLGDIGTFFPEEENKDRSSAEMLKEVHQMIIIKAFEIINIDSTIITESPKLSSHLKHISENIAQLLSMNSENVSVKAKTNEGLDAIGEGLAIACNVNVLLYKSIK